MPQICLSPRNSHPICSLADDLVICDGLSSDINSKDINCLETVLYEHNQFFASRKKLKSLGLEFAIDDENMCAGEIIDCNFHLHSERCCSPYRCSDGNVGPSSSCHPLEKDGLCATMMGNSQITDGTGGLAGQTSSHGRYTRPSSMSGWMYFSEHGPDVWTISSRTTLLWLFVRILIGRPSSLSHDKWKCHKFSTLEVSKAFS